jgi:hypothetical protein
MAYTAQARKVLLHRANDPRDEVEDIWEARIRCHVCDHSYIAVEMDRDPSVTGSPAICTACAGLSRSFRAACIAEHADAAVVGREAVHQPAQT